MREQVLAYVQQTTVCEWDDLKAQIDPRQWQGLLTVVRGLEKEGLLWREAYHEDGTVGLRIHNGQRG